MSNENDIVEMLRLLKINNIYSTKEFERDLVKLVSTNVKKFVKNFTRDIIRKDFEQFNRFEKAECGVISKFAPSNKSSIVNNFIKSAFSFGVWLKYNEYESFESSIIRFALSIKVRLDDAVLLNANKVSSSSFCHASRLSK